MEEPKTTSIVTQQAADRQPGLVGEGEEFSSKPLKTISEKYADVTLGLVEEYGHTVNILTPEQERKLKRKLYAHILLLVAIINLTLFVSQDSA